MPRKRLRWSRGAALLPAVLAGVMTTSALAAVPATALAPQTAPAIATEVPDPVAEGSLSEEDHALQQAASTGQPYEVVSRRTETSDTWAQPGGGFKVTEYGTPVRLWRDGGWVAADPTLQFAADGSVVTKATNVAVKFSGGGTAPLIQGSKDGRSLSLTWPNTLPTPTLDGNIATYAEVLPGVDLQLKAEVEGFSQVFVVKTPEAAKNPQLNQLQFGVETDGLTVEKDAQTGSLTALDPAGQIVFSSSAPMMWDSTSPPGSDTGTPPALGAMAATAETGETTAPAEGEEAFDPGLGALDAEMPTELTSDTLTITPDQTLLNGAETTYPVYIDPSWGYGDRQKWSWTRVYKPYPNNSYWNAKAPVRVGYEKQTGGVSRSFFQLDISHLKGTEVQDATFRVKNTWSWSCEDRPVDLYPTGAISSKTTWANQPGKLTASPIATVNDSRGWASSDSPGTSNCPAMPLEFDATNWVKSRAAAGAGTVTFGLYADEDDTFGWKKFDPESVVLETKYNTPPDLPSKLGTSPATPCATGGTLGNATVSLYATIEDSDYGNLTAEFELFENKAGVTSRVFTKAVPALNRQVATLSVPVSLTPGGKGTDGKDIAYSWRVRAIDSDKSASDWKSAPCAFKVDRQRPKSPPTIVSPLGPDGKPLFPRGDAGWPSPTGKARQKVPFTFLPVESDIKKINWWTDTDPGVKEASPVSGGYSGLVSVPSYGPHMIYAYSVDTAGNRSDTATYLYYANKDQARDELHDVNGDRFKDIWSPDSNGTLLAYTGQGNREFVTMNASSGEATFPGQQVAAVGDWQEDGYNDLLALVPNPNNAGRKDLQVHKNNGFGLVNAKEGPLTLRVKGEDENNHWYDADQIVGGDFDTDSKPDALVKQGDRLWFYRGSRGATLGFGSNAIALIGDPESQWDKYTIVPAGDINGDKLPDLLLRDDATGDLFRSYATPDPANPTRMNFATWGRNPVKVGSGLTKAEYPQLGVSGDLDGDGSGDGVLDGDKVMDLWARKADNTMVGWRGTGTPTSLTGFGSPFTIDGITGGIRLAPRTKIAAGHSVSAQSSTLTMGLDGKLSLTNRSETKVWTSPKGAVGGFARVEDDGDISVCSTDSECVWSTDASTAARGFALLKDSGDLVVYNDKSQSLWSSGTSVRHDYNADGRSDMADWYDFSAGNDTMHTFAPSSDGTFPGPKTAWTSPSGNFYAENMKRVTGDYNGDGVGDVASFYGYADGSVALFTWLGKGDGTFAAGTRSWRVDPGHWWFGNMTPYSGDFNGDGRDDLAVWYDYADTTDTLFTFTSTPKGTFNNPVQYWRGISGWEQSRAKTVTGDFNGDGRDDLATFYHLPDGSEKIRIFSATVNSTFSPADKWSATDWGDWNRTTLHAGDFNGDGRDDVAAWYDHTDGRDTIQIWSSTTGGGLAAKYIAWTGADDFMYRGNVKLVTGDYNGDGKDEFAGFYGYDAAPNTGAVKVFTWLTNATNHLNAPVGSWSAAPGNWSFDRVEFLEKQL